MDEAERCHRLAYIAAGRLLASGTPTELVAQAGLHTWEGQGPGVAALAACMLHEPRLLLLDEPTAGVDPQARRSFWEEIHELAARGITLLVSTHYMDEAERCHRLAYIAAGRLLASGTPTELVAQAGLHTWEGQGAGVAALAAQIEALPGVALVTRFGNSLHVSGRDADALESALRPFTSSGEWRALPPTLEDVFIFLMQGAQGPKS